MAEENTITTPDVTYRPDGVITEHDLIVGQVALYSPKRFVGRRVITTPYETITRDNVVDVLSNAQETHRRNVGEIDYLYNVYRGCQDIMYKVTNARPTINNHVCVNRANEIVTFKSAYLLNEALQYISHGGEESVSRDVKTLNEYMRSEDKESKDKELVDWMHICGVGVRVVLPDDESEQEGAPFYIATMDPRTAYVIYHDGIRKRAVAGVLNMKDENEKPFSYVYTSNRCYQVQDNRVVKETPNLDFGCPPVIEYAANMPRLGAFEPVISILNAINVLESNAVDSIQAFVDAYDVFINCELTDGQYAELSQGGKAISVKTVTPGFEANVKRIASELNQAGTQTRIDDLTDAYLTICGMPNRNGGTSTSDTGTAVIFRDGWSEAESRAKDTEKYFIRSERDFLRVVLRICHASSKSNISLQLKDIGIDFARKSLSNVQSKVQALCEILNNGSIHPKLAFDAFGDIFGDKETAYRISMEWKEAQEAKQEEELRTELDLARSGATQWSISTQTSNNTTQTSNETGINTSGSTDTSKDTVTGYGDSGTTNVN